jgi:hypothetical protein
MDPKKKWLHSLGFAIHLLIGALMIFAGSGKAFGFAPAEVGEAMRQYGLGDRLQLIGTGEMIAAILLIVPRTSPLGTLMTSGFWGGVVCIHMANQEDFLFSSAMLALTWVGGLLRGCISCLATAVDTDERPIITD